MSLHSIPVEYKQEQYCTPAQNLIRNAQELYSDPHAQVKALLAQEKDGGRWSSQAEVIRDLLAACLDIIDLETNPFRMESKNFNKAQQREFFATWSGQAESICRKLGFYINEFPSKIDYKTAIRLQNKVLTMRDRFYGQASPEFILALKKRNDLDRRYVDTIENQMNSVNDRLAELDYFSSNGRTIVLELLGQVYDQIVSAIANNEGRSAISSEPGSKALNVKQDYKDASCRTPLVPTAKFSQPRLVKLGLSYEYRLGITDDSKAHKVVGKDAFVTHVMHGLERNLAQSYDDRQNLFAQALVIHETASSFPYRIEMLLTDEAAPTPIENRFVSVRVQLGRPEDKNQ